ncbi:MAG: MFS transporter [Caulobacteraceae bacterium]|nr:MFS transporter [Caulobacter sp.]
MLASSLAFLDSSVMNVALPALKQGLGGTTSDLQWAINSYALPLSALILFGGAAGDKFGRRRFLVVGITIFALASVGCALAPGFAVLVPMRALQGVGAALLMPNSLALLGSAYPAEKRGQAIGTWAACGVIASAAGPPLGGWLIGVAGWRAIFFINLPLAVAAVAIARRHVPEFSVAKGALDWAGAALATLALGLFAWPLTLWSSRQVLPPEALPMFAASAVAAGLFFFVQLRRGDEAMMPLGMFASRAFVGLSLVTFLIYTALSGLFLLLPYVLIDGGYTPLQAGLALLPFPAIVGASSRLMGRLASTYGPRWPLAGGSCVGALGYALLSRMEPGGSYWLTVVPGAAVLAAGMAGAVAPLTTAVLAAVDRHHTGTASGFNSMVSRSGGLIATALAGAVLVHTGAALVDSFHAAVWVGAAMSIAAGVAAFATLGPPRETAAQEVSAKPATA